jgi:hypothetical protein
VRLLDLNANRDDGYDLSKLKREGRHRPEAGRGTTPWVTPRPLPRKPRGAPPRPRLQFQLSLVCHRNQPCLPREPPGGGVPIQVHGSCYDRE